MDSEQEHVIEKKLGILGNAKSQRSWPDNRASFFCADPKPIGSEGLRI
ncbi:hypothetical protein [Thioclava sp. NG1]|nr:hypothetical protein [Thioclava sp. NG1]